MNESQENEDRGRVFGLSLLAVIVAALLVYFLRPIFWPDMIGQFFEITIISIVVGFLLHEGFHMWADKAMKLDSLIKIWKPGFLMVLFLPIATMGFIFFTIPFLFYRKPGGRDTSKVEEMKFHAAGPLINLIVLIAFTLFEHPALKMVGFVNGMIAFWNLLPINPLDGGRILKRNKYVWGILFGLVMLFLFFNMTGASLATLNYYFTQFFGIIGIILISVIIVIVILGLVGIRLSDYRR